MSAKITDSFPVVRGADSVSKKFTRKKKKKAKDEVKVKADQPRDQQQKVYPAAKDVRDLKILHDFDLRGEYGPCLGISRLERWMRAQDYGLQPPAEVKKIIEEHGNDTKFTQCLWYGEKLIS